MKSITFNDIKSLADYMIVQSKEYKLYIVATVFYDDAIELIKHILKDDDIKISILDISPPDFNGYNREYYVSISEDHDFAVEPAYLEGRYLNTMADVMLIDGDARYNIVKKNINSECIELTIEKIIEIRNIS